MTRPVVLVGCGFAAEFGHLPAITATGGLALAAVVDPNPSRRERLRAAGAVAAVAGAPGELDLGALGRGLVVVATPNHSHRAHAEWAFANGWDVLVEKPMTTSAAATHRLLLSAERAGVTVQPVHNYASAPAVVRLRDILPGLGPIAEIAYHHHLESPLMGLGADAGWRCQPILAGGGALLDLGYHALYVVELLAGSPIVAVATSAIEDPRRESRAVVSFRHRSGARSLVDVGWSQPSFGWSLRVEAAGGHVETDEAGAIAVTARGGQQVAEVVPDGLSFEAMYRRFYAQLATGARDRARQAVRTQRWIERAYGWCDASDPSALRS